MIGARSFLFGIYLLLATSVCATVADAAQQASISPSTYNKLTKIQELMADDKMQEAIGKLKTLSAKVKDDSLDQAIVLQTWGFAEMSSNHYERAVDLFERSLAVGKLPDKAALNVRFLAAQLYAVQGDYKKALSTAEIWIRALQVPTPTQHIFIANLLAQNKRFESAVEHAEAAIAASDQPKENWYQLLLAVNFEQHKYKQAAVVLQAMVAHWSDKAAYWEQLASAYLLLKNEAKALATLEIAWRQGLLDKDTTIKSLVQLAFSRGQPEQAARLLGQAIERQLLAADAAHLKMLADAWVLSREDQQAIAALSRLAEVSADGEPWLRQARIYLDLGDWDAAQAALDKALAGGVKKPGQAWLLSGIALLENKRFDAAEKALRKAQAFAEQAEQAAAWLDYAADRRRQQKWLVKQTS